MIVPLSELTAIPITYGVVQPGLDTPDGLPMLRVNNFQGNVLNLLEVMKIAPEIEAKYERTRIQFGDVLLTIVGSVGQVAIVPKELSGWNIARAIAMIRPKEPKLSRWISLVLRSPRAQYQLNVAANTTVQITINLKDLRELPIPLPGKKERDAIVHILGTLDDKIELNQKMNETLEAMAQALFKSWFVDFDGVAAKDMHESEMGLIPKGWHIGRLEELADIIGGGTPPTSEKNFYCEAGTGISWLSPKDLSGYSWKYISNGATDITELGLNNSSARMLPKGTVLFSSRAPIGYVAIAEKEVCTNQGFKSLIPKNSSNSEFLYYLIKENIDLIESGASGSTFKEISGSGMKELSVICPPKVLMMSFKKAVSDFFERQKELRYETNSLIKIRDTLIPKLISGQLRIKDVYKFIGDAK